MRHVRILARTLEAVHLPAYFDPAVLAAWSDVGLKGYWMGYFASRAAPMGAVTAATVEATFPSFSPRLVRRAIPDAWDLASPVEVLTARDAAIATTLGQAWAQFDGDVLADLADRCRTYAEGIDVVGARASLPLYAGNAARPWPDDPVLVIFRAATCSREYRGDLHLALLAASGIDGVEANVLAGATPAYDREWLRESRGWDDQVWQAAIDRLVDRGWITSDGEFTTGGKAWRSELEHRTDELSSGPAQRFGTDAAVALAEDLAPLAAATRARLPASAPMSTRSE